MVERPDELEAVEGEIMADAMPDPEAAPEPEPVRSEFIGAEYAAALSAQLFAVVAARKGEHWRLHDDEAAALGGALDAVLAKYIPAGADRYGPEIALVTVAASIILPRMQRRDDGAA